MNDHDIEAYLLDLVETETPSPPPARQADSPAPPPIAPPTPPEQAPSPLVPAPTRTTEPTATSADGEPATNPPPAADPPARAWLRFQIGAQTFAVEVLKVQEVLPIPEIVPVRGGGPELLGLMNLRGQLVPVLDLAIALGHEPDAYDDAARLIVLEDRGECLGMRVSEVGDVCTIADAAIEAMTPPLRGRGDDVLRGIGRVQGRTLILLDARALLDAEDDRDRRRRDEPNDRDGSSPPTPGR